MGKTAFALGAAVHVATRLRRPVVFFSLEMGRSEIAQRMVALRSGVDSHRLRTGKGLSDDDWARLSDATAELGAAPLVVDDDPHATVMAMRAKCRRVRARHKDLALVVVDYLQLMSTTTAARAENRTLEVGEISRGLKLLSRDLDVAVLACAQVGRAVESRSDKRPMLSDLRESGSIEADADAVVFLYRDELYNPETSDRGVAEAIIAKNRSGPTGTTRLAFLGHCTRFADLARG